MKILIVSSSFSPEISPRSFRITELCKQFCRKGHEVTLITEATPPRRDLAREWGFTLQDLGKPYFPPIAFEGYKGISSFVRRVIRRLLQVGFEYPEIGLMFQVRRALRGINDFDLLISNAVPHPVHWGVALARKKKGQIAKTWVADCGDPFMFNRLDRFNKPFYFAYFEKLFCRRADWISIPASSLKELFYKKFHAKITEIPQGIDPTEYRLFDGQLPVSPINFGYAGMLAPSTRDPRALLEHLASLTDVPFVFNVWTATPQHIEGYKNVLRDKLQIHKPIPREKIIFELSHQHFNINIAYDPNTTVPSKLIDYWVAKRPILNLPSNSIDPKIFGEFLAGNYQNQFQVPNPERYISAQVAQKFCDLVAS
jgi:hypothetical protein